VTLSPLRSKEQVPKVGFIRNISKVNPTTTFGFLVAKGSGTGCKKIPSKFWTRFSRRKGSPREASLRELNSNEHSHSNFLYERGWEGTEMGVSTGNWQPAPCLFAFISSMSLHALELVRLLDVFFPEPNDAHNTIL
jgi:hypothetical protein